MDNELKDIGRDIKDAVLDAVQSGDFSQLNRRITGSVSDAIDEVNVRLNRAAGTRQESWATPGVGRNAYSVRRPARARSTARETAKAPESALFSSRPKGRVSGLVCTILGGVFLGLCGTGLLVLTILALTSVLRGIAFWTPAGILLPLVLGSAVALGVGAKKSGRVKRFRQYVSALKGKAYCAVAELAKKLGKKETFVVRDLRKMIELRMFPEGHIDDEGKTLLLTDALYQQYQDLKRQRQEEIPRGAETPEETLYRETAEKGQYYLEKIHSANDAIPGESVSEMLYRLEDVVRRIFEQVKSHPQQIPELRRFLDYYMPTTLKLVETYQQLDAQQVAGENIQKSKDEIEKTLDTINHAFENLFDSLFANTAVDISSDISVLKTLLKQEGLTDKDFTS
ncbi:MAG: 5-bromo-4-chloroindolyl phosphate hydrolysis family protein [Oscillospiraceae bacterium]|nr:5-bromo-4-chloroindolyl phosphate hydrolysis family protein [Oscillospiraceae bacterium]